MDKRFWGIVVAVVVVLGAIFIITNHGGTTSPPNTTNQPTNHVEGQGADGVTLVEYGDYECPYCGEYFPIVKQVESLYNQDIYFQFRNLPLTQLHPNAYAGARAAEAASSQGQFWQMHDLLYEQNEAYYASNEKLVNWVGSSDPETYFVQYAQELGLNVAEFEKDYTSSQVNNAILADMNAFTNTGAEEATPTFFLDGKQIQPLISVSSFEQFINAAIKTKTGKNSNVGSSTTAPTSNSTTAPQSKQ